MEGNVFLRWMTLLSLSLLMGACDLSDDRDLCCDTNLMRYRYPYRSGDCFYQYIRSMEYHLFSGAGEYLGELSARDGDLGVVSLEGLPAGDYTLVAIGNRRGYATPRGHTESGLGGFSLVVDSLFDASGDRFANGDPLYWGSARFTIAEGGTNRFVTTMSNVHCRLHVRVEWERYPDYPEGYSLRLDGVGGSMDLHDGEAFAIGEQYFPKVREYGRGMEERVPMRLFALQTVLYTLRYTDRDIPVLRLCHDGKPVTVEIPLKEVFARWGWYPDRTPVQDYEITLLIHANGSVEVIRGLGAEVRDWQDGGVLS